MKKCLKQNLRFEQSEKNQILSSFVVHLTAKNKANKGYCWMKLFMMFRTKCDDDKSKYLERLTNYRRDKSKAAA